MRKVFVLENGGAQKKVSFEIDENVKTLGDLIPMINEKGIDTNDKAFYESKSGHQLMGNDSTLPENTADNGKLIIMVTNAQKKISNGILEDAKRPEINNYVRENNLGPAIKDAFGVSWTNVPSADIVRFINATLGKGKEKKDASTVYDNAVAYVEDCEDDDVRAYLLSLLGSQDADSKELDEMDVHKLFPWVEEEQDNPIVYLSLVAICY